MKIKIEAGAHDRIDCPIIFQLKEHLEKGADYELLSDTGSYPLQIYEKNSASFILPSLKAGDSMILTLSKRQLSLPVIEIRSHTDHLEILRDGLLITEYHFDDVKARPYFHPLFAPGQLPVTRAYPMKNDVPGEDRDHPHHRSLWIAYGEVNETDNWSEDARHGYTQHESFDEIISGCTFGSFTETSTWQDNARNPIMTQKLNVKVWAASTSLRMLDFAIDLVATHGEVQFGDTKEGGILSLRVASEMDVPRTGRITNTFGALNEDEAWGKSAHWCDYSGVVAGNSVGVAILDHPLSFRYPTHWHVRNYGLMTANPFGYSHYTGGLKNGSHTLKANETLSFRYRLILHMGDSQVADIAAQYLNFSAPPRVTHL